MSLQAIIAIRFVTADAERLAAFYSKLGFTAGETEEIPADEMILFGLSGGGTRMTLRLGDQRLHLDRFDQPGAPYPEDINGNDTRFQHIALITDSASNIWDQAQTLGATSISRGGPVALPESLGGVTAIKFRDPDGHPLELLQFPAGTSAWAGRGLLGIDHSAIAVADAAASQAYYEALGLTVGTRSLNHGPTQSALDGLDDPRVDVVPLLPRTATPHLELLGYRTPAPRHAPPTAANDIAATRIVWAAGRDALLRDPDGHLHHLTTKRMTP